MLTIVPGVDCGKELLLLLHKIGQAEHQRAAVGSREQLPGRVLQRLVGGVHCSVNIFGASSLDCGNRPFGPITMGVRIMRASGRVAETCDRAVHTQGQSR